MKSVASLLVFVILFAAMASLIPAMLWYCIDDRLAEYVGIPLLGQLPLSFVYPACLFVMFLFKGGTGNSGSK